jgi:hypothetical protein
MFEAERITGTDFEPNLLIDFIRPPFRRFEFTTSLSPEHASNILQHVVEPPTFQWWPSKRRGYFEGTVEGDRFKISRIIRYRNSFLPVIEGTFRRDESARTLVALNMRMAWPVAIFWFGIVASLSWNFLDRQLASGRVIDFRNGPVGLILFGYFLASVCFAIEARIAMKHLLELLRSGDNAIGS